MPAYDEEAEEQRQIALAIRESLRMSGDAVLEPEQAPQLIELGQEVGLHECVFVLLISIKIWNDYCMRAAAI